MTKETIIKSTLKYLVKRQIEEGSVGFAVDNDPDHDCCWDDVLAWIEAQPNSNEFFNFDAPMVKNSKAVSIQSVLDVINFEDEWLYDAKSHNADTKIAFSAIKSKISELPSVTPSRDLAETSQDCISRQAVDDAIYDYSRSCDVNYEQIMEFIDKLPSVTPKYTDEEIDKAQAVEQAYVDKMVELAVEESRKKWLNSFDTNSATKCYEAVNLLKERVEHEET